MSILYSVPLVYALFICNAPVMHKEELSTALQILFHQPTIGTKSENITAAIRLELNRISSISLVFT